MRPQGIEHLCENNDLTDERIKAIKSCDESAPKYVKTIEYQNF